MPAAAAVAAVEFVPALAPALAPAAAAAELQPAVLLLLLVALPLAA
jgi:hypothetical protein